LYGKNYILTNQKKFIMKNLFIATLFFFTFIFNTANAQIPNANFEVLDTAGNISNWITTGIFSIGINDSILFDGPLVSKSTDAYSGLYAMELRNAFNVTQQIPYINGPLIATLPDSTLYQGFTTMLPITTVPTNVTFYYKVKQNPYNDSTICTVKIFNENQYEIGYGFFDFGAVSNQYTKATVNLTYLLSIPSTEGTLIPTFMSIQYDTKFNLTNPAHVGKRVLIDEVRVNANSNIANGLNLKSQILIFPNPTNGEIYLRNIDLQLINSISIINTLGSTIKSITEPEIVTNKSINTSILPTGIYFIQINENSGLKQTLKFIKE
jgi:hypothetical protein